MIKLGILEAGRPPAELVAKHGDYPGLFEKLLAPAGPDLRFKTYSVLEGRFPAHVRDQDAWLITGARSGVYDGDPWISELIKFSRSAYEAGVPNVGICFGHQILAEALGGRVEKSSRGWGIGVHRYDVIGQARWMIDASEHFAINAMHQDQVIELPGHAEVLAESSFCPYSILSYGNNAISFQGHPEIGESLERDFIEMRRGSIFPEALSAAALATLDQPTDASLVARWIVRFLEMSLGKPAET